MLALTSHMLIFAVFYFRHTSYSGVMLFASRRISNLTKLGISCKSKVLTYHTDSGHYYTLCSKNEIGSHHNNSPRTADLSWSRKRHLRTAISVKPSSGQLVTLTPPSMNTPNSSSSLSTTSELGSSTVNSDAASNESWEMLVDYNKLSQTEQKIHERHITAVRVRIHHHKQLYLLFEVLYDRVA